MFSKVCSSARVPMVCARGHGIRLGPRSVGVCRLAREVPGLSVYYVFIMLSVWLDVSNDYSGSSKSRHPPVTGTALYTPHALRYAVGSESAGGVSRVGVQCGNRRARRTSRARAESVVLSRVGCRVPTRATWYTAGIRRGRGSRGAGGRRGAEGSWGSGVSGVALTKRAYPSHSTQYSDSLHPTASMPAPSSPSAAVTRHNSSSLTRS